MGAGASYFPEAFHSRPASGGNLCECYPYERMNKDGTKKGVSELAKDYCEKGFTGDKMEFQDVSSAGAVADTEVRALVSE